VNDLCSRLWHDGATHRPSQPGQPPLLQKGDLWLPERMVAALGQLAYTAAACIVCFMLGRWTHAPPSQRPLQGMMAAVAVQTYAPPAGHGEVAVPSTHSDVRGAVHNLRIGGFRFNVLVSKAGVLRSGDVHAARQFDMVFRGSVAVTTREAGRDVVRRYESGDLVVIPAHVPHIFSFLNDTVMAEWWDGPFGAKYYRPYRQRVDEVMRRMTVAPQQPAAAALPSPRKQRRIGDLPSSR